MLSWFQEITGASPQISSTHPLFQCSKALSISVAVLTLTCQTFQWIPIENFGVLLFLSLPNAPMLTSAFSCTDVDTLQVLVMVYPQPLVFWFDRDNLSPRFIVNIVNGFLSMLYGDSERIKNYVIVITIFQNHLNDFLMDFRI